MQALFIQGYHCSRQQAQYLTHPTQKQMHFVKKPREKNMTCEVQIQGVRNKEKRRRCEDGANKKNIKLGASPGNYRSKVRKG